MDKSGSPRVTLRINQLKGREEKKERGKSNTDVESMENNNMESAGSKPNVASSATNTNEETNVDVAPTFPDEVVASTGEAESTEAPVVTVVDTQPTLPLPLEGTSDDAVNKENNKRHLSEEDDETKRKRRKEDVPVPRGKSGSTSGGSPKSTVGIESEGEDGIKSVESPGPKVPPLKIVIPSLESEQGTRNGKNGNTRHHQALPYVVASEPGDIQVSTVPSPTPSTSMDTDATSLLTAEEQRCHQRVLRSSHRSGGGSSSGAPSGSSSPVALDTCSPRQVSPTPSEPPVLTLDVPPEEKNQEQQETLPQAVELHPRKRKLKPKDIVNPTNESSDVTPTAPSPHNLPHDHSVSNCYQLFLNIRKQIDRRRKGLFPVQPKPPQGFKDYLMNRCTYVLAGNANSRLPVPQVSPPSSLQGPIKDLFVEQEKERYRLRTQHVIEKEKLVLSVEQEILRVHGRAARALANQSLPFSACTILRDEEVYSAITPEQEEKDRNARSRYNGRLFLSWLQDVDDKWEKIKEAMLLRHHNEAESLHAVQKMDWEWKMKELGLCEFKAKPVIEELHVPMVHVSDDFDLLPAY